MPVCRQARRAADRLASKGIVHVGPAAGQAVEVGREAERAAVDAGGVVAMLIGKENDDVGAWAGHKRE